MVPDPSSNPLQCRPDPYCHSGATSLLLPDTSEKGRAMAGQGKGKDGPRKGQRWTKEMAKADQGKGKGRPWGMQRRTKGKANAGQGECKGGPAERQRRTSGKDKGRPSKGKCYTPKHYLSPKCPDPDRGLGQEPLVLRASSPPPQNRSQHRSLGLLLSHINSTAPTLLDAHSATPPD